MDTEMVQAWWGTWWPWAEVNQGLLSFIALAVAGAAIWWETRRANKEAAAAAAEGRERMLQEQRFARQLETDRAENAAREARSACHLYNEQAKATIVGLEDILVNLAMFDAEAPLCRDRLELMEDARVVARTLEATLLQPAPEGASGIPALLRRCADAAGRASQPRTGALSDWLVAMARGLTDVQLCKHILEHKR